MLDHTLIPQGVRLSNSLDGLAEIQQPDCGAAVCARAPSDAFQHWIDTLPPAQLPKARVIFAPRDVLNTVQDIFAKSSMQSCRHSDQMIQDITALADQFAKLTSAKWLRLRLDVVTTNACRKFHIDAVTARLLCTYRGTGTQLATAKVDAEPTHVHTVPTGAVTILRGTLWPTKIHTGLRHRSPPIEGSGETRLVLVLDPLDAPMEEVCY
ncbi:DUF1826 domain-containing protein [Shimia sp. Alg240-R146]|uniref:DUF1826 domain-containing protein n=1 Tax=Shimia sp. Alg240-R146 TaxID=2993449 RepID=UPI0022E479D5|nr:DUF1826 domain-containing protein [Shimia sp. Alg240-R146]